MKKISRRNFLLASGVVTIGAALAACGGSSSTSAAASSAPASSAAASGAPASAEGKVLNIWCWNDEFQSRFNAYYPEVKEIAEDKSTTTLNDGTIVKWTIKMCIRDSDLSGALPIPQCRRCVRRLRRFLRAGGH